MGGIDLAAAALSTNSAGGLPEGVQGLGGAFGKSGRHVYARERGGGFGNGLPAGHGAGDEFLEMRLLGGERMTACPGPARR